MEANNTPLSADQIKAVKGMGFLHNRGTRKFSGRIITENGMLTAAQMEAIAEAAKRYGNGNISFTVRLTVELPGIDYDNIPAFREFIAKAGMNTGGTGTRVRPIVACKGTTCVFGLCDTQSLATKIHQRFYEGYFNVTLPHKFKIAVGGCPNNCAKPDLNDIGIIGQRVPSIRIDECKGCKVCGMVSACPMGASAVTDKKLTIDKSICNNCGRCVGNCHFKIDSGVDMYKLYIGVRLVKRVRMGTILTPLFNEEQALDTIEKAILLFKRDGLAGERFGQTIDRMGVDRVEELLLSDELIEDKDNILGR